MYPFGQSFQYTFYPLLDNENMTISASMQGQQPIDIRIFTDSNIPSRAEASSGVGGIQTISTWQWSNQKKAWTFTVLPISDPDPASDISTRQYWIGINFLLQAAQQVQTVVKPLQLCRIVGHDRVVTVNQDDLKRYFPQVEAYSSELQRGAYILQAIEEVKAGLRSKGYEWAKIQRADRLDLCVVYKALSMIMLSQIQEPGDKFFIKYQEFKGNFSQAFDSLKFEYQELERGMVSEARTTGTVFLVR